MLNITTPRLHVSEHPLVKNKLTRLRDKNTSFKKFSELVKELAWLIAYEATLDLTLVTTTVETPLATANGWDLKDKVGLVPILRAALGMLDGMRDLLPGAEVWHLGFFRDENTLKPVAYYNKLPASPTVEVCLVLDPMLATGGSAIATVDVLKKWGASRIKFLGLIAAPEGVQALNKAHSDVDVYVAALDDRLNDKGYILPGLGDAGDRQFGTA